MEMICLAVSTDCLAVSTDCLVVSTPCSEYVTAYKNDM